MKRALITLIIGLFFVWLTIYVAGGNSPYISENIYEYGLDQIYLDQMDITDNIDVLVEFGVLNKILDFEMLYVILGLSAVALTLTFAGTHMLIDKLFFRRYHEQPGIVVAIRRGLLISLAIVSNFFFHFVGAFSWANIALAFLLLASIEILIHQYFDIHSIRNEEDSDSNTSLAPDSLLIGEDSRYGEDQATGSTTTSVGNEIENGDWGVDNDGGGDSDSD